MEKKNWNSSTLIQSNEPHCSSELNSIFNPIESTLTSIEISPQSCYSTPLNSPPKLNLSSLIEPQIMANFAVSGNNLTSLGSFNGDPGFIERATKNSCFGSGNLAQFGISEVSISNLQSCKLSRVSSNQSIRAAGLGGPFGDVNCAIGKKFSGVSTPENGELGDSREGSSVSEQNPDGEMGLKAQNDSSSRKRKSAPKSKLKQIPSPCPEKVGAEKEESDAKRSKKEEDGEKEEDEEKGEDKVGDTKPEPPKDYIHVRARRGQATDSHSLAERVRREKISERMKFLQDLVPGCNKVTGKATVLDEIINYVQSLQRQVEFLSMKLATVNPKTDFNMEALLSKDKALVQNTYELGSAAPALSSGYQPQHQIPPLLSSMLNGTDSAFSMNPLKSSIPANPNCIHLPSMDGFEDDAHAISQLPTFWDSDLHSIVQMGLAQTHPQIVQGTLQNTQMKAEL